MIVAEFLLLSGETRLNVNGGGGLVQSMGEPTDRFTEENAKEKAPWVEYQVRAHDEKKGCNYAALLYYRNEVIWINCGRKAIPKSDSPRKYNSCVIKRLIAKE
jgi:hypothetical protein